MREAIDEFRRFRRDKEVNSQLYSKLTVRGGRGALGPACRFCGTSAVSERVQRKGHVSSRGGAVRLRVVSTQFLRKCSDTLRADFHSSSRFMDAHV